jgi:hypothetical protein
MRQGFASFLNGAATTDEPPVSFVSSSEYFGVNPKTHCSLSPWTGVIGRAPIRRKLLLKEFVSIHNRDTTMNGRVRQ